MHEKDYPKSKAKILKWYEKHNLRPIKKEEFKQWCDEKAGKRGISDKLFGRYISYEYIDGISYVMSNQGVSFRSSVLSMISGYVTLISFLKHVFNDEAIGMLFAVGISEDGSKVILRRKAEFNVTKDKSEYKGDLGSKKRLSMKRKR